MPPIRTNTTSTQQQLTFAPMPQSPLNARGTPRRDRTYVPNYCTLKRVDPIITNPLTPRRAQPSRPTTKGDDDDVPMADRDELGEDELEEVTDEEDRETTPTPQGVVPSTVIVRTQTTQKKPRKPRKETTWTQYYFDITPLQDTWVNEQIASKPTLYNRL